MHEKRRHPRVAIELSVTCEFAGQASMNAVVVDLSVGGLFVNAPSTPPFGTEVTIVGDFPGNAGLRLPGIVRWAKPGGFGVQFGLLGARETHTLASIVRGRA